MYFWLQQNFEDAPFLGKLNNNKNNNRKKYCCSFHAPTFSFCSFAWVSYHCSVNSPVIFAVFVCTRYCQCLQSLAWCLPHQISVGFSIVNAGLFFFLLYSVRPLMFQFLSILELCCFSPCSYSWNSANMQSRVLHFSRLKYANIGVTMQNNSVLSTLFFIILAHNMSLV